MRLHRIALHLVELLVQDKSDVSCKLVPFVRNRRTCLIEFDSFRYSQSTAASSGENLGLAALQRRGQTSPRQHCRHTRWLQRGTH